MNAAHACTAARLALAPVFVVLFLEEGPWALAAAATVAILFEATDLADGILARRLGAITPFGQLFDPFADSIARFSVFLAFLAHPRGYAALWMVLVFFYRDASVAFLRVLAARKQVVVAARTSGKVKAWAQGIAILVTLGLALLEAFGALAALGLAIPVAVTGRVLVGLAALVTAYSLVDYLRGVLPHLRDSPVARGPRTAEPVA